MQNIISLFAVLTAGVTLGYLIATLKRMGELDDRLKAGAENMRLAETTFQQIGKDLIARIEHAEQKLTAHDFKLNAPLKKF